MKVQVTRRVTHGHFILDKDGKKTYNNDGSGIPLTDSVVLLPDETIYDTGREPFAGHFSDAEIESLVKSGALKVLPEQKSEPPAVKPVGPKL